MQEFFDAHTHVQFAAYDADREEVIERALKAGVRMVNVGTQYNTSRRAIELAEKYEGLYAAIGLHPVHTSKSFHDADELGLPSDLSAEGLPKEEALAPGLRSQSSFGGVGKEGGGGGMKGFTSRGEVFDKERYRELAMHPKTVAIGECGLDYFRLRPQTDAPARRSLGAGGDGTLTDADEETMKERQKAAFLAQIELAYEVKKPLMIHCRGSTSSPQGNAFPDLISVLTANSSKLKAGVVHFFTGTKDDAKALLNLGFSFTFGGVVTFPPRKGKERGDYDEIVEMIPLDRLLSETDAPYVSPVPYRGKRNEPAYVVEVVKKLAELKDVSTEDMARQILENAERIFSLPRV